MQTLTLSRVLKLMANHFLFTDSSCTSSLHLWQINSPQHEDDDTRWYEVTFPQTWDLNSFLSSKLKFIALCWALRSRIIIWAAENRSPFHKQFTSIPLANSDFLLTMQAQKKSFSSCALEWKSMKFTSSVMGRQEEEKIQWRSDHVVEWMSRCHVK